MDGAYLTGTFCLILGELAWKGVGVNERERDNGVRVQSPIRKRFTSRASSVGWIGVISTFLELWGCILTLTNSADDALV